MREKNLLENAQSVMLSKEYLKLSSCAAHSESSSNLRDFCKSGIKSLGSADLAKHSAKIIAETTTINSYLNIFK